MMNRYTSLIGTGRQGPEDGRVHGRLWCVFPHPSVKVLFFTAPPFFPSSLPSFLLTTSPHLTSPHLTSPPPCPGKAPQPRDRGDAALDS